MKRAFRALLPALLLPVCIFMTTSGASSQGDGPAAPSARDVAEAERAFARRSVEVGWREAFLEFFADDAVSYAPDPGNAKERLRKRPPTPRPQKIILDWWPVYADVSQSGDMGLSTGPSLGYENTPERKAVYNGYYFSVWKVQPDGKWKVAIDVGVETPPPPAADAASAPLRTAPPSVWKRKRDKAHPNAGRDASAAARRELLDLERKLAGRFADGQVAAAYGGLLGEDARLHRDGVLPVVGKAAIVSHLSEKARKLDWRPTAGDAAGAGDFGYTYGAYELTAKDAAVERGYYLHVWRRDAKGRWRLTADVMHPAPPEKK
jgi:ketosteroid isomerase-like protein